MGNVKGHLRLLAVPLFGCQRWRDFNSGLAVLGAVASCWKLSWREFTFVRSRDIFLARGGCKLLETALARIYVPSLYHWAVAPTLA